MQASSGLDLTADHPLIRAVLDSVHQGFSVWGLDHRLIVCNPAYLAIYGFDPRRVTRGTSLREIGELSVGLGNHPDASADKMYALYMQRLETARETGKPVRIEKPIRGRVISSTHTYMPGIGWLVVHEDITEQTEHRWMSELAERSLDTQTRRFRAAIDNMAHGLSIFDAELRLVICNKRYLEIFKLPADRVRPGTSLLTLAEMRCEVGTQPSHIADFVGFIAKATAPTERFVESSELADGRVIQATRSPVPGGGFVAVHEDITEEVEKQRVAEEGHAEMALQKLRFGAALANMPDGLSMYDAEGRLVVCNDRYREMYNAPAEAYQPGMRFADIVARRDAPDGFSRIPDSEEFIASVLGETNSESDFTEVFRMGDGRVVCIRQSAMADGGFIRTHQDITRQVERFETLKRAEREAARQNRVLKQQNIRFDAAINNMTQGLCMFDKHERLVVCNEPYARLYHLPPELMLPGTTLGQILQHRFSHGMVPRTGNEDYITSRKRLAEEGIEAKDEIEFEDGRTIFIHHRPMRGGGWVATHEDVTEQRRIEARVRHLARHDALTELPNRSYLREATDKIGARMRRGENAAVLCLDLDHFKAVNDTLGHAVGDKVLVAAAERIRQCARETDLVVRLGGDEFAMIIQPIDDARTAALVAARIVRSLARPMEIDGNKIQIGTSVGIALSPTDGEEMEVLLKNADTALYRAKSEGRGNHHFFERGMDDVLQRRRMLEQGLKVALAHGEFRLMYQPLIDLATNRICCFEALLRWDHPQHGTISPADFIPVAEETGLISAIGEWVLREACATAANWPEEIRIAVNLSPAQFKQRGLVETVVAAMEEAGLAPRRLELEVTESLLLDDTEHTLHTLHRLRGLGVRISMDDFGTGYSSLSYLRSFPFDKIKIDRTFVAGLQPGDESMAIIKAIVGLGHSLGMSTTAEGIETEAQLAAVREQGCNEVQGFLFSPPLPASAVAPLIGVRNPPIVQARRRV